MDQQPLNNSRRDFLKHSTFAVLAAGTAGLSLSSAVHAGVDLMGSIRGDGSTDAAALGAQLDRVGVRLRYRRNMGRDSVPAPAWAQTQPAHGALSDLYLPPPPTGTRHSNAPLSGLSAQGAAGAAGRPIAPTRGTSALGLPAG